ncbi:MAG TPA: TonB-dependent receptor [Gammaproteobacteria bacterium]|nr:TonB-dependent receptor [Gammaproteobacteria bacterium]
MTRIESFSRALARTKLSLAVAGALCAGFAAAQEATPGPSGIDEVTVTGTRITRDGMSSPTPITAISAEDMQMMAPGQFIDSLDYLPPFFMNDAPDTAASKSQSAGAANVNLRGLGANRTLVLLDGRRMVPSNRLGAVDINLFPEAMIERVEVVTGGASAVYGTDAVAGVVNFILKDDFEGFDIHTQVGATERGDGENSEVSVAYGTSLGERGRLSVSGEWFSADRIETLEGRDWFRHWGLIQNPVAGGPRDLVRPDVVSYTYTNGGLINSTLPGAGPGADRIPTAIHRYEFLPDGSAQPFVAGNLIGANPATGPRVSTPGGSYGTHQITNGGSGWDAVTDRGGSLVPETERGSLFAHYNFDLTDNASLYAQFLAGENKVNSVGTLPLGIAGWAGTIYSGNPFLPANIQQLMTANNIQSFLLERYHTTADLAHDRFVTDNDTRSLTFGGESQLQGGMFEGWTLGGYAQLGRNDNRITQVDFIRSDRLPEAMDVVADPLTGQPACRASFFDPVRYGDCVPINLLGVGRASQQAIDYVLTGDQYILAETEQNVAEFSMEGEVGDGWGAGAISLAFGGGWREESIGQTLGPADIIAGSLPAADSPTTRPDCVSNTVDLLNPPAGCTGIRGVPAQFAATPNEIFIFTNVQPIAGSYSVSEVFAETLLPLLADRTGFEQLDLSLAARYADYEGSGGIWAWKVGLDWQIHDAVRLRTTSSRDIRAATLSERFDRQGVGSAVNDPAFGGLNYTMTQIIGGNPNLNPEEADTVSFGLVWQPSFLEGFSMSADYYEIDIAGALAQVGVQNIVDQCFSFGVMCDKVTRDTTTGRVTIVDNAFVNQDAARVVGTDIEAGYTHQLDGGGTLSARLLATWLNENSTTARGAPKRDVAGETGDGSLPEFKSTTYLRYAKGPFSLFAQERFIGSGSLDFDDVAGVTIDDNSVDSRYYTDMGLTWGPERANVQWQLFFNVQNLFDRDPPPAASFAQFSGTRITNDRLFDFYGRRYVIGVDLTF